MPKINDNTPDLKDTIPAGSYPLVVKEVEEMPTKDGSGLLVKARFAVAKGAECEGFSIIHRFNVENNSEDAQTIGRGQLKRLRNAAGIDEIETSDPASLNLLQGVVVMASVKVVPAQDGYEESNALTGRFWEVEPELFAVLEAA